MKQLRIGDVARVTGVRNVQLSRWLDRHTIQLSRLDKGSTGTGGFRTFSRATINQIAIAKKLIDLGVAAGPANAAATLFTEMGQPGRPANELFEFGLTVMIHSESGTSITNADSDSSLSDVFGRGLKPAIFLNIAPVIRVVDKLILTTKETNK